MLIPPAQTTRTKSRPTTIHSFFFLLLLAVTLIAPGCGNFLGGKKAGEQAIASFHKLYNETNYAEIYSAADPKFKRATTETKFVEFMTVLHRKIGNVIGTKNANFNIRTFNLTTTVLMIQNTTFEQGQGTETFTFEVTGEKAILVGYNINSQDLIMK